MDQIELNSQLKGNYDISGCDLLFIPAAYDDALGVNFWEPVHRARAIDNQMYVFVLSSARKENVNFVLYGRTQIINPVGTILKQAGVKEEVVSEEIGMPLSDCVFRIA